ncbi:hypothetical protein GQ55_6G287700 [Panicum hallii var. hallii]|uniref:Uncharacterized protein n=1 Tax=Panicum hallii var. hallii TaxID=1504633 RepID=A0A2T7DAM8_9POAL|nr:hypothetical protein GQ55_6G287700 [Panicum hallii var. hallii]PUZ52660.1 hypothetical protein GQ55_6G287700 [Panicum hallii var. hallii]
MIYPQVQKPENLSLGDISATIFEKDQRQVLLTLVTVDMDIRTVLSVRPYIKGEQELYGEDADLAYTRSSLLQPFLPAEFSRFS